VKDLYRVLADGVIEYFNRVTCPVEANEALFVIVTFQFPRKDSGLVGIPNIFPGNTMFERGGREDDFGLHIFYIISKPGRIQGKVA
jgi:hypothetical protein